MYESSPHRPTSRARLNIEMANLVAGEVSTTFVPSALVPPADRASPRLRCLPPRRGCRFPMPVKLKDVAARLGISQQGLAPDPSRLVVPPVRETDR